VAHERSHHGHTGNRPAFPAQWFYGLFRALLGDEFLFVTVTSGLTAQSNPVEPDLASASLTPATGARTTRLHRTQKAPIILHASKTAHEVHLALRLPCAPDALASTASRPALVTTRDRPSGGTRRLGYAADLGRAKTEIFLISGLDFHFG
jgi:hypothetical protein